MAKWKQKTEAVEWGGWRLEDGIVAGVPAIALSPKEAALLARLIEAKGRQVSIRNAADVIVPGSETTDYLRTVMHKLRSKIGKDSIRTVSRHGYKLVARSSAAPALDALINSLTSALTAARSLKNQLEGL